MLPLVNKNISTFALLFVLVVLLGGCAGKVPGLQVKDQVQPVVSDRELSEQELLNVSIRVFDPGQLPSESDASRGLSPEIREAEARFIPVHLKYTMQRSGYWGAVRVVPDNDLGSEVLITGRIDYSDGESIAITVQARDSRGVLWFNRQYSETARKEEHHGTEPEKKDTFQDLFTTISNDLIAARNKLQSQEIETIHRTALLQFASGMAPDVFSQYLQKNADGSVTIVRLPAVDDPMLERVRSIQVRDAMLVDAINGYYDVYYRDLWQPYADWRRFRRDEVTTMRELERQALTRQILGVAAIVGAIAISATGDSEVLQHTSSLRDVMILGGGAAVYSGYQKGQETAMNKEVIEELGTSFQAEAEPLVIAVKGESLRLTGSAEEQYARWRAILREIYARETGLIEPEALPADLSPSSETLAPVQ